MDANVTPKKTPRGRKPKPVGALGIPIRVHGPVIVSWH